MRAHIPGGRPRGHRPRDVQLVRGELVGRHGSPFAGVVAGRSQLQGGARGERFRAGVGQELVSGAELVAGIVAAALPAQPLAVDEVGAYFTLWGRRRSNAPSLPGREVRLLPATRPQGTQAATIAAPACYRRLRS
nr:hypothetical protein GCM10020063_092080 [Dactylosporangium thailandense]